MCEKGGRGEIMLFDVRETRAAAAEKPAGSSTFFALNDGRHVGDEE